MIAPMMLLFMRVWFGIHMPEPPIRLPDPPGHTRIQIATPTPRIIV